MKETIRFVDYLHKRFTEKQRRAIDEYLLRRSWEREAEESANCVLNQFGSIPTYEWERVLRFLRVDEFNPNIFIKSLPPPKTGFIYADLTTKNAQALGEVRFGDKATIVTKLGKGKERLPIYAQFTKALDFIFISADTPISYQYEELWDKLRFNLEKAMKSKHLSVERITSFRKDRVTQLRLHYFQRKFLDWVPYRQTFFAYPSFNILTPSGPELNTYIARH